MPGLTAPLPRFSVGRDFRLPTPFALDLLNQRAVSLPGVKVRFEASTPAGLYDIAVRSLASLTAPAELDGMTVVNET